MPTLTTISGQAFTFEKLIDWPHERDTYINAWKKAFRRDSYGERLDWLIGSPLNTTYTLKDSDGDIASAYSLITNQLFCNTKAVKAAICNNVFCVPEYQGLNLFVRLGRLALADAAHTYDLAYGFPNAGALAGHRRVGWKPLDNATIISISLEDADQQKWIHSERISPISADQLSIKQQHDASSKIANIAMEAALESALRLSVSKTKEYIFWRFFQRPKTKDRTYYTMETHESLMLFSIYHPLNEINILEVQSSTSGALLSLLKSLCHFGLSERIHAIKFLGCRESPLVANFHEVFGGVCSSMSLEQVNLIVHELGPWPDSSTYSHLPCALSFMDNDVY